MKFITAACWITHNKTTEAATAHSWYSYAVPIVGHYGVIIEGL